jgi:hypothetical protein
MVIALISARGAGLLNSLPSSLARERARIFLTRHNMNWQRFKLMWGCTAHSPSQEHPSSHTAWTGQVRGLLLFDQI